MDDTISALVWTPSETDLRKEKSWIKAKTKEIGVKRLIELSRRAAKVRNRSYSPYSGYKVGVAVLTASGNVYEGVNAERASYSESDHSEESAITGAIIDGEITRSGRKFITALAVSHERDTAPCGRCRQIIIEHCDNALVIVADTSGRIRRLTSVKTLLPYAFSPSDLGIK